MNFKVLLIEDDDELRELLTIILEKEGCFVEGAENGIEGVKKFRETPFDLVVTDIIMPEKEGIETIVELRDIQSDVKIMAISGGGQIEANEYLGMASNFGVEKALAKPFEMEVFVTSVKEILNK